MGAGSGFLWIDIDGTELTTEDRDILSHPFVSGVILFSRNYQSVAQLKNLTREIRSISSKLIITVDQEGGRVQRFREGFTELPAMQTWGENFLSQPEVARKNFSHFLSMMTKELKNAGVYSSLVPVLDINYNRNQVIGHRSFGNHFSIVVKAGEFFIDQFHALHMPVTGKHFPGHGWVMVDSHVELPIDERSFEEIQKTDLKPFVALSSKLDAVMLAHVVYSQVDPEPVLFSRFWVQDVLRHQLRFDGLILCDDLSMQAVAKMGSYHDRANRALEAGCDIVLVCNSRSGVIDILDRAKLHKNPDFSRRMAHYSRFLSELTIK